MAVFQKNHKNIKAFAWVLLTLETLFTGMFIGFSYYIKQKLNRQRNTVITDPSRFGLDYSLVSFPSRDGLMLRGWWFATDNQNPVVILLHGIMANRAEPPERVFRIARELIGQGYNILTFDFRAHGESEGNYISAGFHEKNDLLGAIDYIRKCGNQGKVGVLGFSMGASISLIAAAESKEIAAIIADSAYVDVISLIKWKLSRWRFLSGLFIPVFLSVTKSLYRFDFSRVKPLEAMKSITVPVFIIHGEKDNTVPVEHAYRLINSCRNRFNQLWIVPEANHTDAFFLKTDEYLEKVISFFKKTFAPT
jgi:uncharacterized protein